MILFALGRGVLVACDDERASAGLSSNFAALLAERGDPACDWSLQVSRRAVSGWTVEKDGLFLGAAVEFADLLYLIEKELVVTLQRERPDLLFLHAAAMERGGKAYLFAAESGSGKSTTAWGLAASGFRYMSDELAAVDLGSLAVEPYPHALCLKRRLPGGAFALPADTMDLGTTLHIPASAMPGGCTRAPRPLGGVFVVRYDPQLNEPAARRLGVSEAAARLYPNVLNALAHEWKGVDAVLSIVRTVPCFSLRAAELGRTCALVTSLVEEIAHG